MKLKKSLVIILAFLVMAVIAGGYFINEVENIELPPIPPTFKEITTKTPIPSGVSFFSLPLIEKTNPTFNEIQSGCGIIYDLKYYDTDSDQYINISLDTPLFHKKGYLINVSNECSIIMVGDTFSMNGYNLKKGWNLIGAPSKGFNDFFLYFISGYGTCNFTEGPWYYEDGWSKTFIFMAGKSYLIKINNDCEIRE